MSDVGLEMQLSECQLGANSSLHQFINCLPLDESLTFLRRHFLCYSLDLGGQSALLELASSTTFVYTS